MIRIVADTNVYVSAIVFGSTCEEILTLARSGIVEINVSPAIQRELRRVLRTGFQWTEPQVQAALTEVEGGRRRDRRSLVPAKGKNPTTQA